MARKNIRTSKKNKEVTYKDVEKALEGRDLTNLSYKDMYELDQLGFGDWLDRNWGNVAQTVGGGVLAGVGTLGSVFTGGASLAATSAGISMMSSGISGMSSDASEQRNIAAQNQATAEQNVLMQRQAQEQAMFQRTAQDPIYGAMLADGGTIPLGQEPEYRYTMTLGGNKPVSLSKQEYDDVRQTTAFMNQRIKEVYGQMYQPEINSFMRRYEDAGYGNKLTPEGYDAYVAQFPDDRLPEISIPDLLPNEPDIDFYMNNIDRYIPLSYIAGGNEGNKTSARDLLVSGRYYSAEMNPKFDIENPEMHKIYTYSKRGTDKSSIKPNYTYGVAIPYAREDGSTGYQNIDPEVYIEGPQHRKFLEENLGTLMRSPDFGRDKTQRMIDNFRYDIKLPEQAYGGYTGLPRFQAGGTINYEGQSHEGPDGGIPVDEMGNPSIDPVALTEGKEVAYSSDQGTYIFSDRLKYSDSKTFAQRAKDLQKKYGLRAKTKGGTFQLDDPISKKGYDMEMQKLIGQQEQLKEMTMPQQPQPQQMGYGDLPMHDGYGPSYIGRKWSSQFHGGDVVGVAGQGITGLTSPTQNIYTYDNSHTNFNPENYYTYGTHKGYVESPIKVNKDTSPIIPVSTEEESVKNATQQQYQGMHWGQAALSALPDVAAGVTNLIRGGIRRRNNPYTQMKAPEVVAEQINLEAERATAREQANLTRASVSRGMRMGAPTAGSYMANMLAGETSIQRGLGQQLGDSYQREAVANAQMRQQAAMANQQMEMQARGYNAQMEAQNRAQADAMTGAGISQIGQGITGAYNQYAADRRHVHSLNMMSPDYALYHDEGSKWYNPKYSRRMTPEGKANQAERLAHHKAEMEKYRSLGATTIEKQLEMLLKDYPDTSKEEIIKLLNQ